MSKKKATWEEACANTLCAYTDTQGLCPKCKRYVLLRGYVCFGCGYDPTAPKEDPQ